MVYKTYVDSSNIDYVEYDDEYIVMRVKFNNGSLYEYSGVPKNIYEQIINGSLTNAQGEKSVGGTFCKLVKNNPKYKYKKLS